MLQSSGPSSLRKITPSYHVNIFTNHTFRLHLSINLVHF